jgi:uncharacterized protein
MLLEIDARGARRWAVTALSALGEAREEIDALNVFPVPDGDTGTNLYLTVEAACAAVLAVPADDDVRAITEAFARGALLGARGNSGIIVAQLLRGWADALAEHLVLDGTAAKQAVSLADRQAWSAVADPVAGTILSVSRACAEAAGLAGDSLPEVSTALVGAARAALARTPDQLEVLRRAGVVDAGGRGYLVLIEALDDLVHERSRSRSRSRVDRPLALPVTGRPPVDCVVPGSGPEFEVMYLLDADDEAVPGLRTRLAPLGDSLVVVGGGGLWHVHVHTDDPGTAVEFGIDTGRPRQVRITHLAGQVERRAARSPRAGVGLVACAAGPGLAALFEQAGAVVVRVGPGLRPSTGEILDAVRRTGAASVVVLPNDPATLAVAQAAAVAARGEGRRVSVLPTRAQVHGLAAAAVHDPERDVDDDMVRMSAAAGGARDGAVTVAAREAITTAGVCRPGDVLGVVQGDFAVIGADLATVAGQVADRLLSGGGELVTLVRGQGADHALVARVAEHVRRTRRDVELCILEGGQDRYPLLLGVE